MPDRRLYTSFNHLYLSRAKNLTWSCKMSEPLCHGLSKYCLCHSLSLLLTYLSRSLFLFRSPLSPDFSSLPHLLCYSRQKLSGTWDSAWLASSVKTPLKTSASLFFIMEQISFEFSFKIMFIASPVKIIITIKIHVLGFVLRFQQDSIMDTHTCRLLHSYIINHKHIL